MTSAGTGVMQWAEPSPQAVREQLARILASDECRLPKRSSNFLSFIVEETLAGRGEHLKAYSIARAVFGRGVRFDAKSDPCVRIAAGRIRGELERYYLTGGLSDPIIITIPKGGYLPIFCGRTKVEPSKGDELISDLSTRASDPASVGSIRPLFLLGGRHVIPATVAVLTIVGLLVVLVGARSAVNDQAANDTPVVLVEPFQSISHGSLASSISKGLTNEIVGRLAPLKELVVIADAPAQRDERTRSDPRYALQGSVWVEGESLRSTVRLIRRTDGAVIWSNNYERDLGTHGVLDTEASVAEEIATAITRPLGVMFQTGATSIAENRDTYSCTLSYYRYRNERTTEAHGMVKSCLERLVADTPMDSDATALLSLTILDEVRFAFQLNTSPSSETVKAAKRLAEKAVQLDSRNAHGLRALMLAEFFDGDISSALSAGAAAHAINPNDREVAGEYGLRLSMSGKWETGCELVSAAVNDHGGGGGSYEAGMALCAFMKGDLQAAEQWSRKSDLDHNPMHRLVLLSILGSEGKIDQAKEQLSWLMLKSPALTVNVKREVIRRLKIPKDQERFFAGLRAGGMTFDKKDDSNFAIVLGSEQEAAEVLTYQNSSAARYRSSVAPSWAQPD